jgi:hypothetical protein
MRVARLLFLTIRCVPLILGASDSAASNPAPQQTSRQSSANTASERSAGEGHTAPAGEAKSGKQRVSRHASGPGNAHSGTNVANANHPKKFPNSQERLTAENPHNLTQSGQSRSAAGVKNGLGKDKTVSPPSMFPSSTASLDNVRHRGPNSAVVGGAANSKIGNTALLNGTRMNRRP